MDSASLYSEIEISSELTIKVYDLSRVYFGDYYHVKLNVLCEFHRQVDSIASAEAPPALVFSRVLEKMAVPSAEVAAVKRNLMDEFHSSSVRYISAPGFAQKLAVRSRGKLPAALKLFTSG